MILPIAVVSVSGGKDSQATANLALDAYGPERVRLVAADTGHEHPEWYPFVTEYLPSALGLPVTVLRAEFSRQIEGKRRWIATHWEYAGVPLARIDRALELLHPTGNPYLDLCMWKGRFPSRMAQFCTQELKRYPLDNRMLDLIAQGEMVESWQGVRRDESRARRDVLDRERRAEGWWIVRPIAAWTAQQAVDFVLSRGQRLNPLYSQGMKRVGCMPCINCNKDELHEIGVRWPAEVDRVREWESLVSGVSKRGFSTFFHGTPAFDGEGPQQIFDRLNVREVIRWAATSRGGKQFDLERVIPSPGCTSLYGLCE